MSGPLRTVSLFAHTQGERGRIGGVELRLLPWQRRIVRAVERPDIDEVVVSLPRGNGKSSLIAHLAHRYLTPGDPIFGDGRESHIVSQSIGQARRTVFRLLAAYFRTGDSDYKVSSSHNMAEVRHVASGTKVSILPASGAGAMGLVDVPFVWADECGSWKRHDGAVVYDALRTATGKPGSNLTICYLSTLAPAASDSWWRGLATGGDDDVWRYVLQGDHERWDDTNEIRRCNPLKWAFAKSRKKLLGERDKARRDASKQPAFLSYLLNYPVSADEAQLLDADKWSAVLARPVPEREGVPILGLDLGGATAWCAAAAVWPTGRIECRAAAAGVLDLDAQERRDAQPAGTYAALQRQGVLDVHHGLHVPDVARFLRGAMDEWGTPYVCMVDRYRRGELRDAVSGLNIPVADRPVSWEAQTEDIGRTRRVLLDGRGAVEHRSRGLLSLAVAESRIQSDDSGNCKVVKRRGNRSRDDALQSLVLAVAEAERCEPDIGHGDTCE